MKTQKTINWIDLKAEFLSSDPEERMTTYKCVGEDSEGKMVEGMATYVCDELEKIEEVN